MGHVMRFFAYHRWSSNLLNASIACHDSCLATNHVRAVTQHKHAYEWIAVLVPTNDRLVVFMWAAADAFILGMGTLLALQLGELVLNLGLAFGGEVDVSNLVVAPRHKIDTGDLGDSGESVWMRPRIVCERCESAVRLSICVSL